MAAPVRRSRYPSNNNDNSDTRRCPPPWSWLLAGILIGIALSFFVYLREILPYTVQQPVTTVTTPPPAVKPVTETAVATTSVQANTSAETDMTGVVSAASETDAPPVDKTANKANGPRFEFYDVLPEHEVKVNSRTVADDTNLPPGADANLQAELDNPVSTAAVTAPGTYLLQVGSFRDQREAEGLKAHLALLGMSAHVERATLNANDVWYRVRLGPFTDLQRLNQTRSQLANNSITAMVLQF